MGMEMLIWMMLRARVKFRTEASEVPSDSDASARSFSTSIAFN